MELNIVIWTFHTYRPHGVRYKWLWGSTVLHGGGGEEATKGGCPPPKCIPWLNRTSSSLWPPNGSRLFFDASLYLYFRPDYQASLKRGFKEDPYVFFDKDSDFFDSIKWAELVQPCSMCWEKQGLEFVLQLFQLTVIANTNPSNLKSC